MAQSYTIKFTDDPDPDHVRTMRAGVQVQYHKLVPSLRSLPSTDYAIFLRNEHDQINGGIVAEVSMGMTYVDLLWLDDSLHGKGLGRALLNTIEQLTLRQGMSHIFLMTTEFQALDFYQHLGYDLFGTLMNRPHGYAYYYLRKLNIPHDATDYGLTIIENPTVDDKRAVIRGLRNYCERYADTSAQRLAGFVYDAHGTVRSGIFGSTYWDWYDLRNLWIDDAIETAGEQLLTLAEAECRRRGMTGIVAETIHPQMLAQYQSHGFDIFATLPDRPPGHKTYFVRKILN